MEVRTMSEAYLESQKSLVSFEKVFKAVDALQYVEDNDGFTAVLDHDIADMSPNKQVMCVLTQKPSFNILKTINHNYPEDFFWEVIDKIKHLTKEDYKQLENKCILMGFSLISYGMFDQAERNVSFFSFPYSECDRATLSKNFLKILVPHLHRAIININHKEMTDRESDQILSLREMEILKWVSKGKTNCEIAMILGISSFTVKNHIANILSKLNVSNRAQALDKAISLGYFF